MAKKIIAVGVDHFPADEDNDDVQSVKAYFLMSSLTNPDRHDADQSHKSGPGKC